MSLFKDKNFDSILSHTKRIHGLEHDATTAEIDAALEGVKSHADVVAELTSSLKTELDKKAQEAMQQLDQKLQAAEKETERLQKEVADLKSKAEQLQQEIASKGREIEALKKQPAAEHTEGQTEQTQTKPARPYETDPVTMKARRFKN